MDLQKYADSLPEIGDKYDDSKWTNADKKNTTNPRALTTPENLYASEYGYHTGNILWRGHFTATGKENSFNASLIGSSPPTKFLFIIQGFNWFDL